MYTAIFLLLMVVTTLYSTIVILRLYSKFRRLNQSGIKTKGTIIDYKISKGRNGDTYFPIVQFKTYSGVDILSKPLLGFDKNEYADSPNEVEVIYLDSNPKEFIIEGQKFKSILLVIVLLFIIGCIFAIKTENEKHPDWINEVTQYMKSF